MGNQHVITLATRRKMSRAQKAALTPERLSMLRRNSKRAAAAMCALPRTAKQIAVSKRTIHIARKIMLTLPISKKKRDVWKALSHNKKSKIEVDFFKLLKRMFSRISSNFHIPKTNYHGDIVNRKNRRVIEVDGAYWHNPERDKRRDKILKNLGWNVLHLKAERGFLFSKRVVQKAFEFISHIPRFPRLEVI